MDAKDYLVPVEVLKKFFENKKINAF